MAKIGLAAALAWWISTSARCGTTRVRRDRSPRGAPGGRSVTARWGCRCSASRARSLGIVLGIAALTIDPGAPLWLVFATIALWLAIGLLARASNEAINPITAVTALIVIFVGKGKADTLRVGPHLGDARRRRRDDGGRGGAYGHPIPIAGSAGSAPRSSARCLRGPSRRRRAARTARWTRPTECSTNASAGPMDTGDVTRTLDRAQLGPALEPPPPWPPGRTGRPRRAASTARGDVPVLPFARVVDDRRSRRGPRPSLVGRCGSRATESMRHADDAAGAVADGRDPDASITVADRALERFARLAGQRQLATDIHGGGRAMLRVLSTATARRLGALIRERYLRAETS